MTRRWADAVAPAAAALLAAACVSFDPAGAPVPDITGTYATTITITLSNQYETRSDTLAATLALRYGGYRGMFAGTYLIPPSDSGAVTGTMASDGTLVIDTLGPPPKPIAAVASIRRLYPWCDWTLLGLPPVRGALAGDTLRASVSPAVPCYYQVSGGTQVVHTEVGFDLMGVR